ncbi:ACP S-malonyltransferase [Lacticaseibacillus jixiensis]|uniref:ACP S-malonyltransferase n=1 Tax=Lacticaseibacillus jixiensis TaxID=3231926 RepID=UPI0036F28E5F
MTTVVMFNGQGAEFVGMGASDSKNSLTFKETMQQAQASLPFDLMGYLFGESPLVQHPDLLQPALVAYELAVYQASGIQADVLIGLSLGEYAAVCAARMATLAEIMQVTLVRGQAMAKAALQTPGQMLAIQLRQGQELPPLPAGIWQANRNAPTQVVVGGQAAALDAFAAELKQAKLRHLPLEVAGAFHTPLMQSAQPALHEALQQVNWRSGQATWSTTAQAPFVPETITETLTAQLTHGTDFAQTVALLAAQGATDFIEISPKPMLAKLVSRQLPQVHVVSLSDQML